jgi:hypothetical protein
VTRLRAAEANPALRFWTNRAVAAELDGLGGGRVAHAGTPAHWTIVADMGYLVDGTCHPGDSLTVPDRPVATLLLPVHAPWSKRGDVVDHTDAVGAKRPSPCRRRASAGAVWAAPPSR